MYTVRIRIFPLFSNVTTLQCARC